MSCGDSCAPPHGRHPTYLVCAELKLQDIYKTTEVSPQWAYLKDGLSVVFRYAAPSKVVERLPSADVSDGDKAAHVGA